MLVYFMTDTSVEIIISKRYVKNLTECVYVFSRKRKEIIRDERHHKILVGDSIYSKNGDGTLYIIRMADVFEKWIEFFRKEILCPVRS